MKAIVELNRAISEGAKPDKTVSKKLSKFLSNRPGDYRKPGIHVTSLLSPCIRRIVWKLIKPELKDLKHPPATQKIFDIGHASHDWWQNRYYGPAGLLIGDWECTVCGRVVKGQQPKERCQGAITIKVLDEETETTCKERHARWRYKEPSIRHEAHGLVMVGNSDGDLYPTDEGHVLEMKTMRSDIWEELNKPSPKDMFQASIYAWKRGHRKVFLSYINKNTWQTKDYIRDAETAKAEAWVDEQLRLIADAMDNPRKASRSCTSKNASRARRCGANSLCF